MGKNSGGQEIGNANQYYAQEAANSNALMQQWQSLYLPVLQKLLPELQGTVEGGYTPLTEGAQAPVKAETAQMLSTMQNNEGGVVNPNALFSNIALKGDTSAALSGDQMIAQALAALQNLTGQGGSLVNTAQGSLNGAAGGEGQIGTNLNAANAQMWSSILGAAGTVAGAGGAGGGAAPAGAGGGGSMFSGGGVAPASVARAPVGTSPMADSSSFTSMPWLYAPASAPISQQKQPNYGAPGFGGT